MSLPGSRLADSEEQYYRVVLNHMFDRRNIEFEQPIDLRRFLWVSVRLVNQWNLIVLPEQYRSKEREGLTPLRELEHVYRAFVDSLYERLQPDTDPEELAAWIEFEMVVRHCFFEAGPRQTSQALVFWAMARYEHPLPRYASLLDPTAADLIHGWYTHQLSLDNPSWESWREKYLSAFFA